MNIGDLVKSISPTSKQFGEIGIVTGLLNNYYVYVKFPSRHSIYNPEKLEKLS
jgi:hypothetical protein